MPYNLVLTQEAIQSLSENGTLISFKNLYECMGRLEHKRMKKLIWG